MIGARSVHHNDHTNECEVGRLAAWGPHLALASLGVYPALLLHEAGPALQVLLDGGVHNGLKADLNDGRDTIMRRQKPCTQS